MKRIIVVIACMMLFHVAFAQFDPNSSLGQQQNAIANTIKAEVEAQAKKQKAQSQQSQTQMRQNQTQTAQQQAIESYTNKMSIEGQIRMEHINNPDVYIDRSITNRNPSLNANSTNSTNRNNFPNQSSDLRTRPVHSEELTSKSLQMLREANREYFSNEDRETTIDPNARVPLFDAPSLGVPLFESSSVGEKPVEEMDMEAVYAELTSGQKTVYDRMKKEILERKENDLFRAEVLSDLSKEIKSEMFGSGIPDVAGTLYAIMAENIKENAIAREQEEMLQLNKLAREAVRNNRNK